MWHDHDIDFARRLHPATWHVTLESWQRIHQVAAPCRPAMWQVALGWHATEFAQNVRQIGILHPVSISTNHHSRHVILHQSAKFYPNRTTLSRKKMMSCRFSRWWISAILDFRGPIMGCLISPCTTSYRSSIETMSLNCLVFEKIAFLYFGDGQTDIRTDGHTRCIKPLSLSRAAA